MSEIIPEEFEKNPVTIILIYAMRYLKIDQLIELRDKLNEGISKIEPLGELPETSGLPRTFPFKIKNQSLEDFRLNQSLKSIEEEFLSITSPVNTWNFLDLNKFDKPTLIKIIAIIFKTLNDNGIITSA